MDEFSPESMKYLKRAGIIDNLTKVLVVFSQEPELTKEQRHKLLVESLCQIDINRIQSENAKWKEKILQEKNEIESLKLILSSLNSNSESLNEKKDETNTITTTIETTTDIDKDSRTS